MINTRIQHKSVPITTYIHSKGPSASSLVNVPGARCLSRDDIRVFSKSGMEHATGGYRGRPYGGVSIICRNNPHILYNEVEILSDRVVAITVSNAYSIIINIRYVSRCVIQIYKLNSIQPSCGQVEYGMNVVCP